MISRACLVKPLLSVGVENSLNNSGLNMAAAVLLSKEDLALIRTIII